MSSISDRAWGYAVCCIDGGYPDYEGEEGSINEDVKVIEYMFPNGT